MCGNIYDKAGHCCWVQPAVRGGGAASRAKPPRKAYEVTFLSRDVQYMGKNGTWLAWWAQASAGNQWWLN